MELLSFQSRIPTIEKKISHFVTPMHIEICGEKRGSYSKTDKSATFMRIKTDYMGNDQLLPAYSLQIAVCEEYIATLDVKQYASDIALYH